MADWNERLREAVRNSGLQQKELAFRAGLPTTSLSRLLTQDDPDPQISTLGPILRALRLRWSDIFDSAEPLPVPQKTPYERNHDYRLLLDLLETLDPPARKKLLGFTTWFAAQMSEWQALKSEVASDAIDKASADAART